jgi:hypothetical protein
MDSFYRETWRHPPTLALSDARNGPIAIVARFDRAVGVPRGFLPRGLSNTYPPAEAGLRCHCPRAGVGQPLTEADICMAHFDWKAARN